jgi:hypothetical protein
MEVLYFNEEGHHHNIVGTVFVATHSGEEDLVVHQIYRAK